MLHAARDWLLEHHVREKRLDMRRVICTLPASRAGWRLEELLLLRVEEMIAEGRLAADWTPPDMMTLGRLPEELYPLKRPRADELTQQYAWVAALDALRRDMPDLFARLIPRPPEEDDLIARLDLGKMFGRLHRELAAEALDFAEVARLCRRLGVVTEGDRWDVLAELQQRYLRKLDELDVWDIQTARLFAIQNREPVTQPPHHKEIVLIGTVDLNAAQKRLLEQIAERVTILVFAPEELRDRFDEFGCVRPEAWAEVRLDLPEEVIRAEGTGAEQATAVLRWLAGFQESACAGEVTVGVADQEIVPLLEEQMRQCDLAVRYGAGTPMRGNTVFLFVESLLRYLESGRFDHFAELLRHPAVDLLENAEPATDEVSPARCRLLDELDLYRTSFLPFRVDGQWRVLADEDSGRPPMTFPVLRAVYAGLEQLLLPFRGRNRLRPEAWAKPVTELLAAFFPEGKRRTDRLTGEGTARIEAALFRLAALPDRLVAPLTALELLTLLLRQVERERIPPENNPEAMEMLGWLELATDDAPLMAVTGMNEGVISPAHSSDMFLPNRVRRYLKLEDHDRRFARDAYTLSVIVESRRQPYRTQTGRLADHRTLLVFGRAAAEDGALLPSRLFFAADPETVARRSLAFFAERPETPPVLFPKAMRAGRRRDAFDPPPPEPTVEPPQTMSVTEFRDYLASPYRYYLRYRKRLQLLDDQAGELDARAFGNLAHAVLKRFGASEAVAATVPEVIADLLDRELDRVVAETFGAPPPIVAVQVEQLRRRLRAFADWQAVWAAGGCRVLHSEWSFKTPLALPESEGGPITLVGRIDRIDRHCDPVTGQVTYYVFDYKTGDAAKTPEEQHQTGPQDAREWIDLQLPLYRYVVRRLLPEAADCPVVPGFILLPKDLRRVGDARADWTEQDDADALETARRVVRAIRANDFHLPSQPPRYADAYSAICRDELKK